LIRAWLFWVGTKRLGSEGYLSMHVLDRILLVLELFYPSAVPEVARMQLGSPPMLIFKLRHRLVANVEQLEHSRYS